MRELHRDRDVDPGWLTKEGLGPWARCLILRTS